MANSPCAEFEKFSSSNAEEEDIFAVSKNSVENEIRVQNTHTPRVKKKHWKKKKEKKCESAPAFSTNVIY